MDVAGRVDWILTIVGHVPADVESDLRLIGRIAGAQLARFDAERVAQARSRIEAVLGDVQKVPELVAVRAVHAVGQQIHATSGSLALTRDGLTRRIAVVGDVPARSPEAESDSLSASRLVFVLPLGRDASATLSFEAGPDRRFLPTDAAIARVCTNALRTWLAGTLVSFDSSAALLDVTPSGLPAFSARIQEELERARRFDLRLALILLDVRGGPSDAAEVLQDALRRELRGSDVTGAMGRTQIAALLTHTDANGLGNVVRRVRERLVEEAGRLNLLDMKMGQAAFSPDVRTADALLDLALRHAEQLVLH
jgi:hypothetical protein